METTLDKIRLIVCTANSSTPLLSNKMVDEVMPKVIEAIDKQAKEMNYDGFTYNRPQQEYPEAMYGMLWLHPIREVVLAYIEEKCPLAWYKPMYFTTEKQREMGMIK